MESQLNDRTDEERVENLRNLASKSREKSSRGDYYSPKATIQEFNDAYGAGEKAKAGTKLIGKSIFNIGRFIGKEVLPTILEQTANKIDKKK